MLNLTIFIIKLNMNELIKSIRSYQIELKRKDPVICCRKRYTLDLKMQIGWQQKDGKYVPYKQQP